MLLLPWFILFFSSFIYFSDLDHGSNHIQFTRKQLLVSLQGLLKLDLSTKKSERNTSYGGTSLNSPFSVIYSNKLSKILYSYYFFQRSSIKLGCTHHLNKGRYHSKNKFVSIILYKTHFIRYLYCKNAEVLTVTVQCHFKHRDTLSQQWRKLQWPSIVGCCSGTVLQLHCQPFLQV